MVMRLDKRILVFATLSIIATILLIPNIKANNVEPVIQENFNYLNTSFWSAVDYSYYGINNGYLYPAQLPSGRDISDTYALKHTGEVNYNSVYLEEKIRIVENDSNSNHNEYNFFMIYTLNSYDIFEVHVRGSILYLMYSTDGGSTFHTLYDVGISGGNYTISAKFSNQYAYYKLTSSAGVLKEHSYRLRSYVNYANFEIYWFWEKNSWWSSNPKPVKYNVWVDEIYLTAFRDSSGFTTNQEHSENMNFLVGNSETIGLWTTLALFMIGIIATGNIRSYFILSGIVLATLLLFVSIGVFQANIITEIFASLGIATFFITIWKYAQNEEGLFTNWGLELTLLFTGLSFLGGEIIGVL